MVDSILPLLVESASVVRKGARLIGPVGIEIGRKGTTVVIGPNGSGKTTLLRLMHGLERPAGGSVRWAVADRYARRRQAFVFQSPIMMRRTVVDCIAYPLLLRGVRKSEARVSAGDWAERIGLGNMLDHRATSLSGGEMQKLALARALITAPEVVFLDEPCANLDGRATREIETILSQARAAGAFIVMSTHDMGQARRLAETVVFMYHGMLHEVAEAARFFSSPSTPEAAAFLKGDIVE